MAFSRLVIQTSLTVTAQIILTKIVFSAIRVNKTRLEANLAKRGSNK